MMRLPKLGLVTAGPVSRTSLARFPNLKETLGPVKAVSLRVASRAVNILNAGFAVSSWEAFRDTDAVCLWPSQPDLLPSLEEQLLSASKLDWRGRCVLLLCNGNDSRSVGRLRDRGAYVASYWQLDLAGRPVQVAEGAPEAIRLLEQVADSRHNRLVVLHPGSKGSLMSALNSLHQGSAELLAQTNRAFESSGIPFSQAVRLAHLAATASLEAASGYLRRGRGLKGAARVAAV